MSDDEPSRPVLRVVRGNPDDTELAALLAVIACAGPGEIAQVPEEPRSRWADRAAMHGAPVRAGPGGWRASALPRR